MKRKNGPKELKKFGYGARIDFEQADDDFLALLESLEPIGPSGCITEARNVAENVLRSERIFDWKKWYGREHELDPLLATAIIVMSYAEGMEGAIASGEVDEALVCAFFLGRHFEAIQAQGAWSERNTTPAATEAKKAKAQARQRMLASYIREQGERPEKRPGGWYDGFRETHPEHAVTDKTLKADYPHALALLRKLTKPG